MDANCGPNCPAPPFFRLHSSTISRLLTRKRKSCGCPLSAPCAPVAAGRELTPCPLPRRISYDPARYPKYLPEAYCLCRGCLTGLFGEEDLRFRSAPVYVPTVILRRTSACAGGRSVYAEEYVTVPVGCTCVPEQEKEADSLNSSVDKRAAKLLLSPSDKPGRP